MSLLEVSTALPGGIGVSLLHVYDTAGPDGLVGGTPHVHLACSEGYYVIGGSGSVQTLNANGYDETPLDSGSVVWFDPGTIHRLVNDDDLQILTLMSNSGLPEAGDAVMTFPAEHLRDRDSYLAIATLQGDGEERTAAAMRRRDLALQGYADLRRAYDVQGPQALDRFVADAVRIVGSQLGEWRRRWECGPKRLVEQTEAALDSLQRGDGSYLARARVNNIGAPTESGRHGMCGHLNVYEIVPTDH
jgi:mannose-6-phosphate isomerase-like protein (cupin superfamily)